MALKQPIYGHDPVLIKTVENYSELKKGDTAIDCTLGLGGHSEMFLHLIGDKGILVAFDQDEKNLQIAEERLKQYKNIVFIHKNFVHLQQEIGDRGISNVKLILFDLGLASTQVDDAERGFSFLRDGPLDMRFDKRNPMTASRVLTEYSESKLADIFYEYGEERFSRKYARKIKENLPIETTGELAALVERFAPKVKSKGKHKHPATKIFQALRIEVNMELDVLKSALQQALDILEPEGRIIVISYHSLEDRIVKRFFKEAATECICDKRMPVCTCNHKPEVKLITRKPISPEEQEIEENPRARSAKLRIAEKL